MGLVNAPVRSIHHLAFVQNGAAEVVGLRERQIALTGKHGAGLDAALENARLGGINFFCGLGRRGDHFAGGNGNGGRGGCGGFEEFTTFHNGFCPSIGSDTDV